MKLPTLNNKEFHFVMENRICVVCGRPCAKKEEAPIGSQLAEYYWVCRNCEDKIYERSIYNLKKDEEYQK